MDNRVSARLEISWAGQSWHLLHQRALYWPKHETLILSDVHLGKAHDFRASGFAVPPTIHDEDFHRLESAITDTRAREIWVLGDFVHSDRNELPDLMSRFRDLQARTNTRWLLVVGNHDRRALVKLSEWGFAEIIPQLAVDGLFFTHDEVGQQEVTPTVCGHVHPVIRFGGGRDRFRLPCFVVGERRLMLPSFGAFTGGFDIKPAKDERIFVVGEQNVSELPPEAYR